MKINPDFPSVDEILGVMRKAETGSVTKVGGTPDTPEQNAEATEALSRIAMDPKNVKVICGGCSTAVAMADSKPCVCGQFICAACEKMEDDDVCDHEPPDIEAMSAAADEAEDARLSACEMMRRIVTTIGGTFDDMKMPQQVRVDVCMSLIINALLALAKHDVPQAQKYAAKLSETLAAVSKATTPDEIKQAVAQFATRIL